MKRRNKLKSTSDCLAVFDQYFDEYVTSNDYTPVGHSYWTGRVHYNSVKHEYVHLLKKIYQYGSIDCSILDVGCGPCVFDYTLMKLGFNITACDYYENKNIPSDCTSMGIPYVQFNLNSDEKFQKTYDIIICSEVLEHTSINLKNSIKKLLTACHSNSILIITLPNIYSINHLLRICRGINIIEDFPDEIVMKGDIILDMREHKRECTRSDLLKATSANNLRCIDFGNCHSTVAFNHPFLAKVIPPPLRAHIYGIFTLSNGNEKA